MITFNEFFEIFKNSKDVIIGEEQLITFYGSIKKSVIFLYARKYAFPKLLKLEEDQWPVLRKIGDPKLDIYNGVNKELLAEFVNSIKDEEELRLGKSKLEKNERTSAFHGKIKDRTELYTDVFKFTEGDIAYCEKAAERYIERIVKEKKRRIIMASQIKENINEKDQMTTVGFGNKKEVKSGKK